MKNKNFLLAPITAILLAACGGEPANNNAAASASSASTPIVSAENVVKVAVEPVYPPFVQPTAGGSDFMGFDMEVLRAIGEREGFQVQITPYPWEGLFNRLNTGEADIIAGGIAITEERKTQMDFTESYEQTGIVIAVPKDSTIENINDLRNKNVFYQKNSAEMEVLKTLLARPELEPTHGTESAWLSLKAVMNANTSHAEAAIGQSASFEHYLNQYKDSGVKLIYNEKLPIETLSFAVKKGNTALLSKLNKGLASLKADGTLKQLHDKWIPNSMPHQHQHPHTTTAASAASAASVAK